MITFKTHFHAGILSALPLIAAGQLATSAHAAANASAAGASPAVVQIQATNKVSTPLAFINTAFENASPLFWEVDTNGAVQVYLFYDQERSSPNRAAGHWHFQLQGTPGAPLQVIINNLNNVWNGRPASVATAKTITFVSDDGRTWKPVKGKLLPGGRLQFDVLLSGPSLFMARLEPYRISDLDRDIARWKKHGAAEIIPLGNTVEGRSLELVRLGNPKARHRILLRARAHPWEPGGNWVIRGVIDRLLEEDTFAREFLQRHCIYAMPMANKDGVARGRTRFNVAGKDLNRDWDKPADAALAPENAALERWLADRQKDGDLPTLALELHNDDSGLLHISRPPIPGLDAYLGRMKQLEALLRERTWFTEGSTGGTFRNSGTLAEGLLMRYGIDAVVHELNANWIAGLADHPSAAHWQRYGELLCDVFDQYFQAVAPTSVSAK